MRAPCAGPLVATFTVTPRAYTPGEREEEEGGGGSLLVQAQGATARGAQVRFGRYPAVVTGLVLPVVPPLYARYE